MSEELGLFGEPLRLKRCRQRFEPWRILQRDERRFLDLDPLRSHATALLTPLGEKSGRGSDYGDGDRYGGLDHLVKSPGLRFDSV